MPPLQTHGHYDVCGPRYVYGSTCSYECDSGYELPPAPFNKEIECIVKMEEDGVSSSVKWNYDPTACGRKQIN